jgi:hypothetical protein
LTFVAQVAEIEPVPLSGFFPDGVGDPCAVLGKGKREDCRGPEFVPGGKVEKDERCANVLPFG